jgi:hypothetical protein
VYFFAISLGEFDFSLIFKFERLGIDGVILVHPLFITELFIQNGLKINDLLAAQSHSPILMKNCFGLINVPNLSFIF